MVEDCSEFEDASQAELREASVDLQRGRLSPDGLKLFGCQAHLNPTDWRAQAMLGQALVQRPGELDDAIEALRKAYALGPSGGKARYSLSQSLASALEKKMRESPDAEKLPALRRETIDVLFAMLRIHSKDSDIWLLLGKLINNELPVNEKGAVPSETARANYVSIIKKLMPKRVKRIDQDPAVAAWAFATKLSPKKVEAHEFLAWRLMQIGEHKRAQKYAKKAAKIRPKVATTHEAVAATLMAGHDTMANMTSKHRTKAIKAIKAALWIRNKNEKSEDKSEKNTMQQARNHYDLFRLLSTDPSVDETQIMATGALGGEGIKLVSEAVKHINTAAELDPEAYRELAENFKEFEDAIKQAVENTGGVDLSKLSKIDIQRMLDAATDR